MKILSINSVAEDDARHVRKFQRRNRLRDLRNASIVAARFADPRSIAGRQRATTGHSRKNTVHRLLVSCGALWVLV